MKCNQKITVTKYELFALYKTGITLDEIASIFGASRQRVHQILSTVAGYKSYVRITESYNMLPKIKRTPNQKLFDKFISNIKKINGCWVWEGAVTKQGYGQLHLGQKFIYIHRWAFEYFNKVKIPKGLFICHHCDNPPCCNPEHLFLGTPKDNIQDSISKGRFKPWGKERRL